MILITAATENFGKTTIDFLLEKGVQLGTLAAMVRDRKSADELLSKGVIVRIGQYDNYASMVDGFRGVHKLLLVPGTDLKKRRKQHESAITAAKEAGVKHILYASYEYKNETKTSQVLTEVQGYTEKVIKESGIAYTIFCNDVYPGMVPFYSGEKISGIGVAFSTVETPSAFTLVSDMAEIMATVLLSEGHENKEYFLSNTETASLS